MLSSFFDTDFGEGLHNVYGSLTRIKHIIVLILTMVDKQGESLFIL